MSTTAPSKNTGGSTSHSRGDQATRSIDGKKARLAALWPEWNEADVNAESWDIGSGKKKETGGGKGRADIKSASSAGTHGFEDPDGKVELPPSLKIEQWKRPIDFLPADKLPVIVDTEQGMQNFDLVTSNEHLHYNETMRNMISQINALWDICRRDRKSSNSPMENLGEPNLAVMNGRTWRPWEHIYALNKVSRLPFISPYNPAGKYVVRLFFLGTWRKITVDDTIPFDAKNRCLLPQTSLPYELWPMLLSKALLKIIALDFRPASPFPENNEVSVIHSLTGWIPEPIPLKYTHAGKVWNFLRYDRSNKIIVENEADKNKTDQPPSTPVPTFGPVPLFKWPDTKVDLPDDSISLQDPSGHHDDAGTETYTKKSDDKSPKKGAAPSSLNVPKDASVANKAAAGKENRAGPPAGAGKDTKKLGGAGRGVTTDDAAALMEDQTIPEAPKMIVFATIPHLQPTRHSSYSETADRSERLRRYNLNETFSTSMLLTSIRDIPLEPPPPPEFVPSWKLIRPKKPKVIPHAEPVPPQEEKPERWIEIASPYINYPSPSAIHMNLHSSAQGIASRLSRSATHSTALDVTEIVEVDEEGDIENIETKGEQDVGQGATEEISPRQMRKEDISSPNKEGNPLESSEGLDDGSRYSPTRTKRERSADKNKANRKLTGSKLDTITNKVPSDAVSVKSRGGESEQNTPMDVHAPAPTLEQQDSQSKSNPEIISNTNTTRPIKKLYTTPKIWMDFDDFCECFTSVVVFHNPRGFQYVHKHTEIKFFAPQQPTVASLTKEKKKEANPPASQSLPNLQDEKSPLYLFVDSTRETIEKNIELIISLSSLSRWYDVSSADSGGATGSLVQATTDKQGKLAGVSTDKTATDVSPARGLGGRQRTSTFETMPQTPGSHTGQHDGTMSEGSHKDVMPQPGSLIAEIYSWKSLSMGQPILRLHTTATKGALLTLPPGRHVLKLTVTCPLASHLQIMSDTNDFTFGDEDHLLSRIVAVPEDAEFSSRAEELFLALDDAIQNFHNPELQNKKLSELFHLYCSYAPPSSKLTVQSCWKAFNQALYNTLRILFTGTGNILTAETQFAWRCFTNDLNTPDIIGAYESRRPSASRNSARVGGAPGAGAASAAGGSTAAGKRGAGGKDKTGDEKATGKQPPQLASSTSISEAQDEPTSEWLLRDLTALELNAVLSIQKMARGFLQRRVLFTRTPGTEKNIQAQQLLQNSMATLKVDAPKTAALLFRNLMIRKPQLIQCFQFRNDDWNMVTYRDYIGQYAEQPANTWFTLFREIFYVTDESFVSAKLLSHSPNSLLRVINNDNYEEMPLVFNRLAPALFTKNKMGFTFFAESLSQDQPLTTGRFRLRLLTSYTHLPEPRNDPISAAFFTKEIKDYYLPNRNQIICRYRVTVSDDLNQTGRNFHLASIQFTTSKSDVLFRLSIFDNQDEVTNVEGKGTVVLPAFLFMRDVTNTSQTGNASAAPPSSTTTAAAAAGPPTTSRPQSKTGGAIKKDGGKNSGGTTQRGSVAETGGIGSGKSDKEKTGSGKRSRSSSRTGHVVEEEEKVHKYIVQVTLLRKSWPLAPTQWQFVEQLKEQEKNELKIFNRQPSPTKGDGTGGGAGGTGAGGKKTGQTGSNPSTTTAKGKGASSTAGAGKGGGTGTGGRPGTGKGADKSLDTTKAHWILRIVSDADKNDEITIKKDTERNEELINMKKAWENFDPGRAQKAMKSRQKFLESLQPKAEEPTATDGTGKPTDGRTGEDGTTTGAAAPAAPVPTEQIPPAKTAAAPTATKKSASSTGNKKGGKDDGTKQIEPAATPQELVPPVPVIDEPLLDEPPPSKPKVVLPPIDVTPFSKHKMLADEPVILDPLFEQEELRRRQADFAEYNKYMEEIRHFRDEDHNNRYKEKIRQLEEYVELQAKIDQARRTINEPREAFRQRFLEVERKRLAELAAQEQEMIAAAEKAKAAAAPAKKGSAGKKGKK